MKRCRLAHDQGTSGNKATLFTVDGELVASTTHAYETTKMEWMAMHVSPASNGLSAV